MQLKTIASFEDSCSALSAYAGSYDVSSRSRDYSRRSHTPWGYGTRAFPLAPPTAMACHDRTVVKERRDAAT